MVFLHALASTLRPWSDLYNGNSLVSDGVTFVHLSGMLVAGGFAVASDRTVLRSGRAPVSDRAFVLRELRDVHRPVLWGLGLVLVSGVAMMLSDVKTFLPSWVFWTKMGLIALLLLNGLVILRAEHQLAADPLERSQWRRLRNASMRSGGLWVLTLLFGVLLTSAG